MTNISGINQEIRFVPVMGFVFSPYEAGYKKKIRFGDVGQSLHFMASNWSITLKNSMIFEDIEARRLYIKHCRSGLGLFTFAQGLLLDFTSMDILFVRVEDPFSKVRMWLVSDLFDTPRCPPKYKTMRIHWRKYMMMMVANGRKICKIDHKSLQKFKMSYNYSPTEKEMNGLRTSIINAVDSRTPLERQQEAAAAEPGALDLPF